MGDDRPNVYEDTDGRIVYRASALGSCPVSLARARQGYTPMPFPAKFKEYFARGNQIEDVVKADLREAGWQIRDEQELLELAVTGQILIRGHIDGASLSTMSKVWRVLEIKATNAAYFKELEAHGFSTPGLMQKYLWQTSVYLHAMRLMTENETWESVLVFRNWEDDNPLTNTAYFYMEQPHYTLNQIKARVIMVEGWVRSDTVPVECDVYEYPCPFYYLHPPEDREEINGEEAEEIGRAAETHYRARERQREAKSALGNAAEELRDLLGGREKVTTGEWKVTQYVGSHQEFDRGKFATDHPDIDVAEYFRSVPNSKPSVKVTPRPTTQSDLPDVRRDDGLPE